MIQKISPHIYYLHKYSKLVSISILQVLLDSSNIIYFKKDDEADDDIPRENTCLFFCSKKLKRDQFSKAGDIAPQAKNIKLHKNLNKQCVSTYKYLRKSSNRNNNVGKKYTI